MQRTDQVKVYFNGLGIAGIPSAGGGAPSNACLQVYSQEQCKAWARAQDVKATWNDTLSASGYVRWAANLRSNDAAQSSTSILFS